VKSAAETMRPNPKLKVDQAITELGVGEALVSLLDEKGRPNITERAFIVPPGSRLGPVTEVERKAAIAASPIAGHYERAIDRESAYEKLQSRTATRQGNVPTAQGGTSGGGIMDALGGVLVGRTGPRGGHRDGLLDAMAKGAARTIGSQVGREIVRGVLGSILGGGKRR